jgi:hypothetical protein
LTCVFEFLSNFQPNQKTSAKTGKIAQTIYFTVITLLGKFAAKSENLSPKQFFGPILCFWQIFSQIGRPPAKKKCWSNLAQKRQKKWPKVPQNSQKHPKILLHYNQKY